MAADTRKAASLPDDNARWFASPMSYNLQIIGDVTGKCGAIRPPWRRRRPALAAIRAGLTCEAVHGSRGGHSPSATTPGSRLVSPSQRRRNSSGRSMSV